MKAFQASGQAESSTLGPSPKAGTTTPDYTHRNAKGAGIVAPIMLKDPTNAVPALPSPEAGTR